MKFPTGTELGNNGQLHVHGNYPDQLHQTFPTAFDCILVGFERFLGLVLPLGAFAFPIMMFDVFLQCLVVCGGLLGSVIVCYCP